MASAAKNHLLIYQVRETLCPSPQHISAYIPTHFSSAMSCLFDFKTLRLSYTSYV